MARATDTKSANNPRLAALQSAMNQIEKQFGKGAIMKMGDREVEKVAVIPTGSLMLDMALGIGGIPKGRVVEIYGPEASGKCLTKDTMIWTERGLESIEEIFSLFGQRTSCTSRITDVRHAQFNLVNERGQLERLDALTHNNRKEVFKITLENGRAIEGTHNHPLRVINTRGQIVWKNIGKMEVGDHIVSALFGAEGSDRQNSSITTDEALILGYLVAEGSLGPSCKNRVHFSNHDQEVVGEYKLLMKNVFGADVQSYRNDTEHHINNKVLREKLANDYGLVFEKSAGKSVPHCIRTASNEAKKAFLSSLFEGDGAIERNRGCISYASASETLARQVQLMLMGFGVPSSIREKRVKGYEQSYWEVLLGPSAAHRFVEKIGFRSARRASQWSDAKTHLYSASYIESVPNEAVANVIKDLRDHVGGDRVLDNLIYDLQRPSMNLAVSGDRLVKILDWFDGHKEKMMPQAVASLEALRHLSQNQYTYEKVRSIESVGLQPTFDVALGQTHSFIANGVLSHNTTLTLQAIAECQKQGGTCAFVDAEHALDPIYAQALGVDLDELLLSQPDTGEQALEIVDMLINSGAVDLVVIDSVAALTPRAELEGEMGDSLPGLQARLMSQALRKITGATKKTNTTVVFINQIRHKIGMMMPGQSPETTTGGNALKFYASVRLDIRRIGSVKKGDEIIGNQVKIKVVKNKMAPPFRQVVTEIIFGQGISQIGEIIDLGVEHKFIDKAGAWYAYDNAKIGQGKEQTRAFLKDNPEIMEKIKQQILSKINDVPLELAVETAKKGADADVE